MVLDNIGLIISNFIKNNILMIFLLIFLGVIVWYALNNIDDIKEKLETFER